MSYMLEGLQVLDFTRVVAGPYSTRILADLGAEVTRVDQPPLSHDSPVRTAGSAANNIGKRSLAIDLKTDTGFRVALALASRADVIVENFRPGVMAKLGLGYEPISHVNPSVIFASISGFGHGQGEADMSYEADSSSQHHVDVGPMLCHKR
jgi:CoA:oxalate CoA-transferase